MIGKEEAAEAAKHLLEMMGLRHGELVGVMPFDHGPRRRWLVLFKRLPVDPEWDPGFGNLKVLVDMESGESKFIWDK